MRKQIRYAESIVERQIVLIVIATRALGDRKLPATWEIAFKDIGRQTVQQIVDALPELDILEDQSK